jgi:hypothetical protein
LVTAFDLVKPVEAFKSEVSEGVIPQASSGHSQRKPTPVVPGDVAVVRRAFRAGLRGSFKQGKRLSLWGYLAQLGFPQIPAF